MRGEIRFGPRRGFRARLVPVLGILLLEAGGALACDSSQPVAPAPPNQLTRPSQGEQNPIVVTSSGELAAALSPENAGRRIHVRAGEYAVDQLLTVPDGATLEGEGLMLFDRAGLPVGFAAGTRTTLTMTANVPGDMLSLGDRATVRGLALVDQQGRVGSVIATVSRTAGDQVSASIVESEVVNPNPAGIGPAGPMGYGLVVVTRNLNGGADPLPDEGAVLSVRMVRSLIRSPAQGGGLFAFTSRRWAECPCRSYTTSSAAASTPTAASAVPMPFMTRR